MKKLIFISLLFTSLSAFPQNVTKEDIEKETKPLVKSFDTLRSENLKLKKEIGSLNNKLLKISQKLDSIQKLTEANNNAISQTNSELGIKIKETNKNSEEKISTIKQSLSNKSLWGIIGVLLAILFSWLLYKLLSKRQKTDKIQLSNIIAITKTELTQESAKLDVQLLDVIEKQLKVADKLNATEPTIDHTFHKNSANEIQRIANYANTLDPVSQEAIALQGSLGRLKNYFNASDYEITDFTGKEYDERIPMRIRDTKYDESLAFGKEIIFKTWEPQIKYKGTVIQEAKIDKKYNN